MVRIQRKKKKKQLKKKKKTRMIFLTLVSSVLKNFPAGPVVRSPPYHWFDPWVRRIPLKEKMATHSSILAWIIRWTEEPGALQSMGSQRVGHDGAHTRLPREG